MNKDQKLVIIALMILLVVILLFPPYQTVGKQSVINEGFVFILSPPDNATINIAQLVVQEIGAFILAGLAWLLFKK